MLVNCTSNYECANIIKIKKHDVALVKVHQNSPIMYSAYDAIFEILHKVFILVSGSKITHFFHFHLVYTEIPSFML